MGRKRILLAGLSIGVIALLAYGRAILCGPQQGLPQDVVANVETLRAAFEMCYQIDLAPGSILFMERQEPQAIAAITAYAQADPVQARLLSSHVQHTVEGWAGGDASSVLPPLAAEAYVLAKILPFDDSGPSVRRGLSALYTATTVYMDRSHALIAKRDPAVAAALRAERRHQPLVVMQGTTELLWCCDRALAELYLADEPLNPPAAAKTVDDYWAWRKAVMKKQGWSRFRTPHEPERSLDSIEQLIAALPEK